MSSGYVNPGRTPRPPVYRSSQASNLLLSLSTVPIRLIYVSFLNHTDSDSQVVYSHSHAQSPTSGAHTPGPEGCRITPHPHPPRAGHLSFAARAASLTAGEPILVPSSDEDKRDGDELTYYETDREFHLKWAVAVESNVKSQEMCFANEVLLPRSGDACPVTTHLTPISSLQPTRCQWPCIPKFWRV